MPSSKNLAVIASAGARKTEQIIDSSLQDHTKRVLITTYTARNLAQIKARITQRVGSVPANITVSSWFSFLLYDWIRPYQNFLTSTVRVEGINFTDDPERFANRANIFDYYIDKNFELYHRNVADFAFRLNETSGQLVVKRLESIFDQIYVDEMQDLAGYDLELLKLLMKCRIQLMLVGDPRQSTYSTSNTSKNRQYQKLNQIEWLRERQREGLCEVEERFESFRCNQEICDFADLLYPTMRPTISKNIVVTGHDGIHLVDRASVEEYVARFQPVVLRHARNMETLGMDAINFGESKGDTFDRVLIFPTAPIHKFLETKSLNGWESVEKLYVAVTRAKYSAAFVVGLNPKSKRARFQFETWKA